MTSDETSLPTRKAHVPSLEDDEISMLKKVIDRIKKIEDIADKDGIDAVPALMKTTEGIIYPAAYQDIGQCPACVHYRKPCSEAPYEMYKVSTAPKYFLDCFSCPVGAACGICGEGGDLWTHAWNSAKHGNVKNFKRIVKKAISAIQHVIDSQED
jgi:hypothetical protein